MSDRTWFVPLGGDEHSLAAGRVFAFPHAGAGCAQLAELAQLLPATAALWAANLPGRQARLDEPPPADLDLLVAELTSQLAPLAGDRFTLFGVCGGGLLALLVAQTLRDRGGPHPVELVVASTEAPDIAHRPRGLAGLPSTLLWQRLIAEGGIPAGLAANEQLRMIAEPAVRADLALLAGYRHRPHAPLPCPVTVCFGTQDPTPRGVWLGWRRQTIGPLRLRPLPGGHWLLDQAGPGLAAVLADPFRGTKDRAG